MNVHSPVQRPTHLPLWDPQVPPPGYNPTAPPLSISPPNLQVTPQNQPNMHLQMDPAYPSHRHSYHGGIDSVQPPIIAQRGRVASFNETNCPPGVRFRNANVLRAQRSVDQPDHPPRCQGKRFSATSFNILSSLPEFVEKMDPANKGRRDEGSLIDHTMQQGPDLHEGSPRAGSIASLNSTASGGKEPHAMAGAQTGQTQPHHGQHQMMGPGGMPMEGRVLVDPATGQHYIVPSQAGNLYYPPMYYPHPAQPSPYGYGYPPPMGPQGYMQNGQPGTPTSYMQMPQYPGGQPRYAATPPAYRHAPFAPMTSLPSTEDLRSREGDRTRYEDHPPPSPSYTSKGMHPMPPNPYYNVPRPPRASPPQPEDPEARDNFRRDVNRSSAEFARNAGDFNRQGSGEFSRSTEAFNRLGSSTPHGSSTSLDRQMYPPAPQPNWWSRPPPQSHPNFGPRQDGDTMTDVESSNRRVSQPSPPTSCASDNEAIRRAIAMQQEIPSPPKPPPKAVRMDIDFNKPLPDVEEMKPKPKPAKENQATAFTVTFDSEPGADNLSLQDAARKSGTGRRLLGRRSGAPSTPSGSSGSGTARDERVQKGGSAQTTRETQSARPPVQDGTSKHYLLNKLLQGPLSSSGPNALSPEDTPQINNRKDNDAVSEAGTFVIGANEAKSTGMVAARVVGDSSSDSESDTSSSSASSSRSSSLARPDVSTPVVTSPRLSAAGTDRNQDSSSVLLKELIALKRAQHPRPSTTSSPTPSSSVPLPRLSARPSASTVSQARAAAPAAAPVRGRQSLGQAPTNRSVYAQKPTAPAPTNPNFRRQDGGRFSMRTGGPAQLPPGGSPQMGKKPPFRAGNASARPLPTNAQKEQEMTAWLRRKDYNPMKAALEAKKAQAAKQRGDNFMSNRSMSFHVGPSQPPLRKSDSSELMRNKSDESLAYEGASTASQRVIAEYSREVVKDINKLSERSKKGDKKELSGLGRAVDMLSTKCKKSIELIRSQNKGCLSVSVEDLLSTAVEPPKEHESLAEQLERLSDAFDAVQRYLEQSPLEGRMSPLQDEDNTGNDEMPETSSMVSGFSSLGLRGKPRFSNSVGTGSLAGTQDLGTNRALRTTAYRSRILSQQKEAHLGKNN